MLLLKSLWFWFCVLSENLSWIQMDREISQLLSIISFCQCAKMLPWQKQTLVMKLTCIVSAAKQSRRQWPDCALGGSNAWCELSKCHTLPRKEKFHHFTESTAQPCSVFWWKTPAMSSSFKPQSFCEFSQQLQSWIVCFPSLGMSWNTHVECSAGLIFFCISQEKISGSTGVTPWVFFLDWKLCRKHFQFQMILHCLVGGFQTFQKTSQQMICSLRRQTQCGKPWWGESASQQNFHKWQSGQSLPCSSILKSGGPVIQKGVHPCTTEIWSSC